MMVALAMTLLRYKPLLKNAFRLLIINRQGCIVKYILFACFLNKPPVLFCLVLG